MSRWCRANLCGDASGIEHAETEAKHKIKREFKIESELFLNSVFNRSDWTDQEYIESLKETIIGLQGDELEHRLELNEIKYENEYDELEREYKSHPEYYD